MKFKLKTGKPNYQQKPFKKLKQYLTKEDFNSTVKNIIREEISKLFKEGDTQTAPAPEPTTAPTEPDVKPGEKPRRRTLTPPKTAPAPKPKAKTSPTINKIVQRYRSLK